MAEKHACSDDVACYQPWDSIRACFPPLGYTLYTMETVQLHDSHGDNVHVHLHPPTQEPVTAEPFAYSVVGHNEGAGYADRGGTFRFTVELFSMNQPLGQVDLGL